jgi:hypothetical protein
MSREGSWQGITPIKDQKIHSPGSDDGGATLRTESAGKISLHPKMLGKLIPLLDPEILELTISELKNFLDAAENLYVDSTLDGEAEVALSISEAQLQLLHLDTETEIDRDESSTNGVKNAVLLSGDILGSPDQGDLPQYGLLGSSASTSPTAVQDSRLFLNTNIPFSAFVCGVQGSGKSHTTACMIGKNSPS